MSTRNKYENPLTSRYASAECSLIFSPHFKFSTWRKMWLRLAEGEQQLGLQITDQQLDEMRANLTLDETTVAFAREMGSCGPLAAEMSDKLADSAEQQREADDNIVAVDDAVDAAVCE